ncbi:RagB/SusD family nutrient uptake outer membrane protein [candidate division KSB1 bacterium]|nr:RagB/SusD family nutrient uptake outer membrane protein [candidate division KSB1 bacterium]
MWQNKFNTWLIPGSNNWRRLIGVFGIAVCMMGCNIFDVNNPGAIMETDLNTPVAIPAVVSGAGGDLAYAFAGGTYPSIVFTGILADEMQHVGSYSDWREMDDPGLEITVENISLNAMYDRLSRARWVGDDGVRRIKAILGADAQRSAELAQILVYAGFSHLILADLFGAVPFDGGPLTPETEVYQRAVQRFTEAITVGEAAGAADWVQAAYAGRARAYYYLNNFSQAVADAQHVPDAFRFELEYSENSNRENNMVYWANITRNESSVSPEIRQLFAETHDSRIKCARKGMGGDGNREWWTQEKYVEYASPVRLTGWQEMELIQAEAKLGSGDLAGALIHINKVRAAAQNTDTGGALEPRAASSDANQVREWLIHERRVEFFLEGRRQADCRHFGLNTVIKNTPPFFPIPADELDSNPNL